MSIATTPVYDAIRTNAHLLPPGLAAGYSTGSGSVPWSAAEWAAHRGAVRIDQDPAATDHTADILDVEAGAATVADCPRWCEAAVASFAAATRPGQRHPAIYCSLSTVTAVVDELIAGGIVSGPGLWVANWNLTLAEAQGLVAAGSGPFPIVGVQWRNAGTYDVSVFSVPWLSAVSTGMLPPPVPNWTETLVQALPTLAQGTTGDDVRTLQGCLGARGHPVAIDGAFGPATRAALEAFQVSRFLAGDGICGQLSWSKLLNR